MGAQALPAGGVFMAGELPQHDLPPGWIAALASGATAALALIGAMFREYFQGRRSVRREKAEDQREAKDYALKMLAEHRTEIDRLRDQMQQLESRMAGMTSTIKDKDARITVLEGEVRKRDATIAAYERAMRKADITPPPTTSYSHLADGEVEGIDLSVED